VFVFRYILPFAGNPPLCWLVRVIMTSVVAFDPQLHQRVRFNDQLFAIFLSDEDFNRLPPNAEVVIHFVSRDKIFYRRSAENGDIIW
jgi:hypothetical protein